MAHDLDPHGDSVGSDHLSLSPDIYERIDLALLWILAEVDKQKPGNHWDRLKETGHISVRHCLWIVIKMAIYSAFYIVVYLFLEDICYW